MWKSGFEISILRGARVACSPSWEELEWPAGAINPMQWSRLMILPDFLWSEGFQSLIGRPESSEGSFEKCGSASAPFSLVSVILVISQCLRLTNPTESIPNGTPEVLKPCSEPLGARTRKSGRKICFNHDGFRRKDPKTHQIRAGSGLRSQSCKTGWN